MRPASSDGYNELPNESTRRRESLRLCLLYSSRASCSAAERAWRAPLLPPFALRDGLLTEGLGAALVAEDEDSEGMGAAAG